MLTNQPYSIKNQAELIDPHIEAGPFTGHQNRQNP